MPACFKTLPPHREKVDKNVAQRVAAGFVTDVIVIFRSVYRKPDQRVLLAPEPEARAAKIQILESAVMKSLDVWPHLLAKLSEMPWPRRIMPRIWI